MPESKAKNFTSPEPVKPAPRRTFKYPSEDEIFIRRLGSAVLANWSVLPAETRNKIVSEALSAWDREYHVPALEKKLETFIKRYPGRLE